MKSRMFHIAAFTTLFAVVGCVSIALWKPKPTVSQAMQTPAPDLQNDEDLQRECATLFKDILKIQDSREQERQLLHEVTQAFSENQVGQERLTAARTLWLGNENTLATEAATLYSEGRTKGCFQRVTQ